MFVQPDGPGMERLAALLDQGTLQVPIFARLKLEQIAEAHSMVEGGHTKGKVVVVVAEDVEGQEEGGAAEEARVRSPAA